MNEHQYNFDQIIIRANTDSIKYDTIRKMYNDGDMLGMRIADTDFATPQPIIDGLKNRLEQKVLGYTEINDHVYNNIIKFYKTKTKNNWEIKKEWINFTPGVLPILGISLIVLTKEGDEIISQVPGYPPLTGTVLANRRIIKPSELIYDPITGDYTIDFDDLKKQLTPKSKFMLVCNPHNPTGKVWKKEDLKKIGEFCLENHLIIISDEINGFLNFKNHDYTPMASISPEIANITISCFSPGKLFDIPGAVYAFSVIPNDTLREEFQRGLVATGATYADRNILGLTVLEHAYDLVNLPWLDKKMEYIEDNAMMVDIFLKEHLPKIIPTPSEGTFLKWLNFNAYGFSETELENKIIKEAKIAFLAGQNFGDNGKGFYRMNIGCPKAVLKEALNRLHKTFR